MDEYYLLGTLSNYIDNFNDSKFCEFINKYNTNYLLIYPLIAVELGCFKDVPHSMDNLLKRCVAGYVYSQTCKFGKELTLKTFNHKSFNKFLGLYDKFLLPLYQNYRFAREINDINHLTKAKLTEKSEGTYYLTTSLVTNKYKEENFYFYGVDDATQTNLEKRQIEFLYMSFYKKIMIETQKITDLVVNIDTELYNLCVEIVRKDINKWQSDVKSSVFSHSKQLADVIGYLYYQAMLVKISYNIRFLVTQDIDRYLPEMILKLDKKETISSISKTSGLDSFKVEGIINYLINRGNLNFLEFPLFEVEDYLISVPSLILANDWSFTIINGHYTKDILIKNRDKNISTITENRLDTYLKSIANIATAKVKQYVFIDEENKEHASDIDYAIYDMNNNMILIIEAKWIDNHYIDEIDIRYGKVLNTFNKIFNRQIPKHMKFLGQKENINWLFAGDKRFKISSKKPDIKYLAVDKRNQLHIDSKHMVSEYMLIYFLKKYTSGNILDLPSFWAEIETMHTKVEYIKVSDDYLKIDISDQETIYVEDNDVSLNLKIGN